MATVNVYKIDSKKMNLFIQELNKCSFLQIKSMNSTFDDKKTVDTALTLYLEHKNLHS